MSELKFSARLLEEKRINAILGRRRERTSLANLSFVVRSDNRDPRVCPKAINKFIRRSALAGIRALDTSAAGLHNSAPSRVSLHSLDREIAWIIYRRDK